MLGKRAIELSLNFIIILIISIVIFGFGVRFISKLSREAIDIEKITTDQLDEIIGDLVCEGSDRVCIGTDRKTISRGKWDTFGVKIINILDGQHFIIAVSRPNIRGYTKNKVEIRTDNLVWNPKERDVFIGKNEEETLGIAIQVPPSAVSGTYIFNVEIKTVEGNKYANVQKLYVDVP